MKKVLCISCLVAIFVACGDDNGNNVSTSHNAAEEPPKQEVSTIYELGVCGENNEMTSIFVTEENAYYFCNGVEWQKFLFESSSSILGAISSIVKSSSDIAIWSSSSQTNILGSSISLSSGVSSSIKKTVSSSSSSSEVELGILRDARDGQA